MAKSLLKLAKKNKVLLGALVLLEVASIPAAATMVDRVKFGAGPVVIVADVNEGVVGTKSFLVSSNTAFVVEVGGIVGEVEVEVASGGYVGAMRYGDNAQMPGVARMCSMGRLGTVEAYRAERKTAASRGDVRSQAVRVDVHYDRVAAPFVQIVAAKESSSQPGQRCERR